MFQFFETCILWSLVNRRVDVFSGLTVYHNFNREGTLLSGGVGKQDVNHSTGTGSRFLILHEKENLRPPVSSGLLGPTWAPLTSDFCPTIGKPFSPLFFHRKSKERRKPHWVSLSVFPTRRRGEGRVEETQGRCSIYGGYLRPYYEWIRRPPRSIVFISASGYSGVKRWPLKGN